MKKSLNIQINFTNRTIYTLIVFGIFIVIAIGVFALTPGVAPNPGHLISEVAPPLNCGNNQVLQWSGANWACTNSSSGSSISAGAVMSFNLANCPIGWSKFTSVSGRAIIGTGQGTGLTNRVLNEVGGEETHTLTTSEMPSHSHSMTDVTGIKLGAGASGFYSGSGQGSEVGTGSATGNTGGNQPHNIMQPYIALLYCVKN